VAGFGLAMRSYSHYLEPRSAEELARIFGLAAEEGLHVALRGTGNSYGDAAIAHRELVVDTAGMNRVLSLDQERGIIEVEPGVTIRDLWTHVLPHGFWPAVVPGTMKPTLAGIAAMNVHGKNNYKVGPIGDHVIDFDLLTPAGEHLRCSRTENRELFHAAISGFGMLGAFTRLKIGLKHVESGFLRVESIRTRDLAESFEIFEQRCPEPDYLVGWLDGVVGGRSAGRGVLHAAHYIPASEDKLGPARSLRPEAQELPSRILGVPKSMLWMGMRPFLNNLGVRCINAAKYQASRLHRNGHSYLQSHVGFAFLLDYVPEWRRAYGLGGLIQYQPFVPRAAAQQVFGEILALARKRGLPPYLVVLKRHRPDDFLLTHAVDGYSLAMDLRVTAANREALWKLGHDMSEIVLAAGGRFYFAKDALLAPHHVRRAWGAERWSSFLALKRKHDPRGVLRTDLARRLLGEELWAS
jgi:FAD/FMN-containing dehydrogenase